ncbi:MAG: tRNA 4-thiouridine(8) synthase ThiI [Candidatus Omnitrophota bacterium]
MKIKALALVSGGLDSLLAAKLIQNQGIEVVGVHFKIPFCKLNIKNVFCNIGFKIIEIDLGAEFLKLILKPRYGFGSNMNPCIDCKILMFSKAKILMEELGAKFIITGEVLGQRPMSENKQALKLIKKRSGLDDLLLRPLSAHFFPPSLAEVQGWVKREKLLKFNGRRRNPQTKLAKELGILKFPTPAGGCLLTDADYSKRLEELLVHAELNLENLALLKMGRHFRIGDNTRLVVGRNEGENNLLEELARPGDCLLGPQKNLAGPSALMRGFVNQELILLSSEVVSAYTDIVGLKEIEVFYRQIPQTDEIMHRIVHQPKSKFVHLLI